MERIPKHGPDWEIKQAGAGTILESIQVDFDTGVKTTWIKNPRSFWQSRTDELANSSLRREMYGFANQDRESEKTYAIESDEDGLHNIKRLELSQPNDSPIPTLVMIIKDKTELKNFYAVYPTDRLEQIQISHHSNVSTYESLIQRPFSVNLEELAQFYRVYGSAVTFCSFDVGVVPDGTDSPIDRGFFKGQLSAFQRWDREGIDKVMENWTYQEQTRTREDVTTVVKSLITENLGNEFQQADLDTISLSLIGSVLRTLPVDFNKNESSFNRYTFIRDLLAENVATLLTTRRNSYEELSEFTTFFKFNNEDKEIIEVVVDGYRGETIYQGKMRFGEQYRYDNYSYSVDRNEKGKIVTKVDTTTTPKSGQTKSQQITVPQIFDKPEFTRLITSPDVIRWKEALDIADIEYQKA